MLFIFFMRQFVLKLNLPIKDAENFNVTPILETNDCFIAPIGFKKDYIDKDSLKN